MKRIVITLLLSYISISCFSTYSLSEENFNNLKIYLQLKSKFSTEEINNLTNFLEESAKEDLPIDLLSSKIKEGVNRGVGYEKVFAALKNKTENIKIAKRIVKDAINKKIEIKDKKYSIRLLSELFDTGLTENDWNELSGKFIEPETSLGVTLEDVIAINNVYLNLIKMNMSRKSAKEIILAAENRNMKRKEIEMISFLIQEAVDENLIGTEEIKSIIIENINRQKGIGQIQQEIIDITGKSRGKTENPEEENIKKVIE